jgi:arylsulfatase
MNGRSIQGLLKGTTQAAYGTEEFICGEMQDGKWVRQGDFKAVSVAPPYGASTWQLYNLSVDPGETNDLAKQKPEKLEQLKTAWKRYADEVGVVAMGQR